MHRFATMDALDLWYHRLTAETLLELSSDDNAELAVIRKARKSTSRVFAESAVERQGDRWNIVDRGRFVYHDDAATAREIARFRTGVPTFLAHYADTLPPERRALFDRYELHDIAVLTPGVGSVGRRCFLLLLVSDGEHPLFLQCKEARDSVLETHHGKSGLESLSEGLTRSGRPGGAIAHAGERIVRGQKLMQSASDIFLGWAGTEDFGEFYVRQLRDMKATFNLEQFTPADLIEYAEACGYGLARAHAKANDPWPIVGWLGRSDVLNKALVDFACAYADVNESDWQALKKAVDSGRLQATIEEDE